jgi:hypothetical protein
LDPLKVFIPNIIMIRNCFLVLFHLHKYFWPEGLESISFLPAQQQRRIGAPCARAGNGKVVVVLVGFSAFSTPDFTGAVDADNVSAAGGVLNKPGVSAEADNAVLDFTVDNDTRNQSVYGARAAGPAENGRVVRRYVPASANLVIGAWCAAALGPVVFPPPVAYIVSTPIIAIAFAWC